MAVGQHCVDVVRATTSEGEPHRHLPWVRVLRCPPGNPGITPTSRAAILQPRMWELSRSRRYPARRHSSGSVFATGDPEPGSSRPARLRLARGIRRIAARGALVTVEGSVEIAIDADAP